MILHTILRIQAQYNPADEELGWRRAKEKLVECERRCKYLQYEIDRLVILLDPGSPKSVADRAHFEEVTATSQEKRGRLSFWRPMAYLTTEALDFKLGELVCKHNIEEKVKEGYHNYLRAISGLHSSSAQLQEHFRDACEAVGQCEAKLKLLSTAIKAYRSLMIDRPLAGGSEDGDGDGEKRGPLAGKLTVRVHGVAKASEDDGQSLMVTCAVDGREKFTLKLKRSERCPLMEGVEVDLSEAQPATYLELLVRTKDWSPVGLIFFKLDWAFRDGQAELAPEVFALEPEGLITLSMTFRAKAAAPAAGRPTVLARHNAMQRRRFEKLGHQLYTKKVYQLMKCAVCQEFLYQTSGYRCELCKFICHKDCLRTILTKCVSTGTLPEDQNPLADIHYDVPHRFQESQSFMPAWCMHCGKFGRKDVLRCGECESTCHRKCLHNIPNYCRMPTTLPELAMLRLANSAKSLAGREQRAEPERDAIANYEVLKTIGRGNFGKVLLARHTASGQCVAIKALKKALVVENDELDNIQTEHEVFRVAGLDAHPFLVQLHSYFSDTTHFYFVMEYVAGGDLMFHIQKRRFSADEARVYAAQVLLALEYLHQHDIVYRDLKLDNIMLTADGHVKLCDYGLCKLGMDWRASTSTFCGTPEFIAPEILAEKTYTRAVDWWAFGVLVYELVLGQVPAAPCAA